MRRYTRFYEEDKKEESPDFGFIADTGSKSGSKPGSKSGSKFPSVLGGGNAPDEEEIKEVPPVEPPVEGVPADKKKDKKDQTKSSGNEHIKVKMKPGKKGHFTGQVTI